MDLAEEHESREGLLQRRVPGGEDAVVDDGVVRVARHVEHPELGAQLCTASARSRPLISGMTTSVSRRWIGLSWDAASAIAAPPLAASSTGSRAIQDLAEHRRTASSSSTSRIVSVPRGEAPQAPSVRPGRLSFDPGQVDLERRCPAPARCTTQMWPPLCLTMP